MKKHSKIYTALVLSGAMFGANSAFSASCSHPNLSQSEDGAGTITISRVSHDQILNCKLTAGFVNNIIIIDSNDVLMQDSKITTEGYTLLTVAESQFTMLNSTLISSGDNETLVISYDSSTINIKDSELISKGNGLLAGITISSSKLDMQDSRLTTHGNGDDSVHYYSPLRANVHALAIAEVDATLGNVTLSALGENSILFSTEGSSVIGNNVTASVKGKNSYLFLNEQSRTSSSTISLTDSTLSSDSYGFLGSEIYFGLSDFHPTLNLLLNNSSLTVEKDLIKLRESSRYIDDDERWGFTNSTSHFIFKLTNNSTLSGGNFTSSDQLISRFELADSTWKVTKPVTITDLTLSQGEVNLTKADGFQTFTILGNLSGTGSFSLNTNIADQQGDKIIVKGSDSGNFGLKIADSGNEPNTPDGRLTLVETQTGNAQFKLQDRDYVDAGAYRYRLLKEGTNWVLSNKQGEPSITTPTQPVPPVQPIEPNTPNIPTETVKPIEPNTLNTPTETAKPIEPNTPNTPTETAKPIEPNTPNTPTETVTTPPNPSVTTPTQRMLSERTNAFVSLRQAQLLHVEQSLTGIHQRLGELKDGKAGNVWVRHINTRNKLGELNVSDTSRSSGFKQDYHSLQIGADTALSENFRLGGFIGSARSNIDFNGEYSSGKIHSQQFGLYGTLMLNNGFYWDNLYKYERLKTESVSTGKQQYHANTLSTEIGRIYRLADWTITPQLQAAWTKISGKNNVENLTALYGRIGLRIGKAMTVNNWTIQPYAEINGVTGKNSAGYVHVNQHKFEIENAKGRLETALGINAATGNHRFGIEAKTTNGKHLAQPFTVQAVYRYQW
ncbi:autotransporter outer membrane beta-barrel domain-containing protein [Rodentibacter caecimuris]|uniref:autotransporter outer membrane beta-barrel domain-containing protein n=1 Tax=Rodentibacter caecimuris TaxID=1796644 RepID=UPI00211A2514|nr:autotransporter outer membrane beta-barrel domain-containing protein [Rodentibacter heylii]MCQ9122662.1 autotransporter outer membrane beta-barrel domain-containing protein [Rodentibacter heylii]